MSRFVSLSLSLSLMASGLAVAQDRDPNVIPRDIIGNGAYTKAVWEPAVAVGEDFAVTVFHAPDIGVKYAVYDLDAEAWVFEGPTDDEMPGLHDPSIAYNSITGEFVACSRTGQALWTNVFAPSSDPNDPAGQWAGWVKQKAIGQAGLDKPWIIAGEMTEAIQEFYVLFWAPMGYMRTITGGHGHEWSDSEIYLNNDPNQAIDEVFPFPAVWQAGALYAGYRTLGSPYEYHLLVGQDIDPVDPNNFDPNDPADVGVSWAVMQKACELGLLDDPVPLVLDLYQASFSDELPGGFPAKSVPQIVADPSNDDRLLVVFHDVEDSNSTDVNVYLYELTRPNGSGLWCASERILVNNDQIIGEQDQWGASATIDEYGYVHIIFYDDRAYTQDDSEEEPLYDVMYAWAPPDELDFSDPLRNIDLFAVPSETAYDGTLNAFDPHEYNGIAFQGDLVFTTYAGTWASDFQANKASVASSRIKWHDVP